MKKKGFGCVKKRPKNGQNTFRTCEKKAINGQNAFWSYKKMPLNGQKPFSSFGTKIAAGTLYGRNLAFLTLNLYSLKNFFAENILRKKYAGGVINFCWFSLS